MTRRLPKGARRGRGRPPSDNARDDVVRLRVTPEEKARLERAAGEAGVSALIRERLADVLEPTAALRSVARSAGT